MQPRLIILIGSLVVGGIFLPSRAWAQQLVPVDQAVGDLDLLATSFRHVETGLRSDGQETALYQLVPSGFPGSLAMPGIAPGQTPIYYRTGPWVPLPASRMDYLVITPDGNWGFDVAGRKDNYFIELVPANVVYDFNPNGPLPPSQWQMMPFTGSATPGSVSESDRRRVEPRARR